MNEGIAWLAVGRGYPGRIAFLGFPGLMIQPTGHLLIDPDRQEALIAELSAGSCAFFVAVFDEAEAPEGAFDDMTAALDRAGITILHRPIEDFGIPDPAFRAGWQRILPDLRRTLAEGGAIALSCLAGLGRSGMMAAQLLVDCGWQPDAAVKAVRALCPEAIESDAQLRFLRGQPPA